MNSTKNKQEASTKLKKLQDEEKELVAAVAKLKNIKNKLKVRHVLPTVALCLQKEIGKFRKKNNE